MREWRSSNEFSGLAHSEKRASSSALASRTSRARRRGVSGLSTLGSAVFDRVGVVDLVTGDESRGGRVLSESTVGGSPRKSPDSYSVGSESTRSSSSSYLSSSSYSLSRSLSLPSSSSSSSSSPSYSTSSSSLSSAMNPDPKRYGSCSTVSRANISQIWTRACTHRSSRLP
ncbi:hypothetical protein CH063_12186 [Colletotrichum higginsianum]|uniref:Uncharacterized protein n=1 Tax=Colletotrichum higginsianum (strain IMI 349063) TaxID=759273 RepID=H1VPE4_COLHI|nr:hypothetical protein CH063_12186 [Colletotrichum higginsianum]